MFKSINSDSRSVLVKWIVQKHLVETTSKYFKGSLIDIRCGTKPYQELVAPYITEHIGVDHEKPYMISQILIYLGQPMKFRPKIISSIQPYVPLF
jgi:hypothetical protein